MDQKIVTLQRLNNNYIHNNTYRRQVSQKIAYFSSEPAGGANP